MSQLPRVALGRGPNARAMFRRRLANVVSVQGDYTCTVKFPGDSDNVDGVRYASHVAPEPGGVVLIDTDGLDLIVIGSVAGNGGAWPSARVYKTGDQLLSTTAVTQVVYSTASFDPWAMFDNANDELVAPLRGYYLGTAVCAFSGITNPTTCSLYLRSVTAAGATIQTALARQIVTAASGNVWLTVSDVYDLNAGERLRVLAQASNTTTTVAQSAESNSFTLTYLGPDA